MRKAETFPEGSVSAFAVSYTIAGKRFLPADIISDTYGRNRKASARE